ncbi:putative leucine-rich repeat receptor-like serine/threonine-protein kinase At2g24130 isoform X2 [Spinacia oleracea]|uniref:Leucine-rich repeat receptor-like serine/threonine-protein kinase At2g24130 isoform X2 n=1 Tax=Spinacia oleracea TaxID=3562 RepID=A0ABM3RE70_SPIOL|nr:putative leucine-rich repeat receptor-like serine/threonine-protein kinase At2g24130 isoform X2 [Spinacia oleracea]
MAPLTTITLGGDSEYRTVLFEFWVLYDLIGRKAPPIWGSNTLMAFSAITYLTKLKHLNLQNNLSVSIPINIVDMISLVELHLENNHISGEVPPMLRKTQFLDLSNNIISGNLTPEILVDFSVIKYLNLSRNKLYGAIPSQLGQSSYVLDLICQAGFLPCCRNSNMKFLLEILTFADL